MAAIKSDISFGEVVNLGSNFEISISHVADIIPKTLDVKIDISSDQTRNQPNNSEVERLWADNSKAKAFLNWQPPYSGLDGFEEGIEETIGWFNKGKTLRITNKKYIIFNKFVVATS